MIPGEILHGDGEVPSLPDREVRTLRVTNAGDRPIQVGSHYHFAEANPALHFDREAAHGWRLAIPAGTSERFEPGLARDVEVIDYGGARIAAGFDGRARGGPGAGPDGASAGRGATGVVGAAAEGGEVLALPGGREWRAVALGDDVAGRRLARLVLGRCCWGGRGCSALLPG